MKPKITFVGICFGIALCALLLTKKATGQATVHQPMIISTNLIGGYLYTNTWDQVVEFSCVISNNLTVNAGVCKTEFWMYPPTMAGSPLGRTNPIQFVHSSLDTVARTNSVYAAMKVYPRWVLAITNLSTGSGNDSQIQRGSGQIFIP